MPEKPKRFSVAEASADVEWGRHRLGQWYQGVVVVDENRFRLLLDDLAAALEVARAARGVAAMKREANPPQSGSRRWLETLAALDAALDKWTE